MNSLVNAYREFLEYDDKEIEASIRKATSTGRPLGTEGFIRRLEKELLEPKQRLIYSFRIDKKYRAIFIVKEKDLIEIISITKYTFS